MAKGRYPFEGLFELAGVGVAYDYAYCVRVRHRKATCQACADACPTGALTCGDGAFLVDVQRCVTCGACVSACPTGALVPHGSPAEDGCGGGACDPGGQPEGEVSAGVGFRFPKVQPNGTLAHRVPPARQLFLEALETQVSPGDPGFLPDDAVLDGGAWRRVRIDREACTSCRQCATLCPTGALYKFHTAKGTIGVKHAVERCVACGLCEAACPTGALRLEEGVTVGEVRSHAVGRIPLPAPRVSTADRHSMANTVRKLIDVDQVTEL